jgi:transcriptional regulator of acetoin/glycerol metabolism
MTLKEMEKSYITEVLSSNRGKMNISAQILGISRYTLYRKIKALDIKFN